MDHPHVLVSRYLGTLEQDASVRQAAGGCIQAVKQAFAAAFPTDALRAAIASVDSPAAADRQLVRFCGLVVGESQDDQYYLPMRLSADGHVPPGPASGAGCVGCSGRTWGCSGSLR